MCSSTVLYGTVNEKSVWLTLLQAIFFSTLLLELNVLHIFLTSVW